MRYLVLMGMLVPVLAMMAVSAASASPATRAGSGPSVTFTVSARIIGASASVGAGHAPPLARMVPRRTTVSAADGRPVRALIYDFE